MTSSVPPRLSDESSSVKPMGSLAAGLWVLVITFSMHILIGSVAPMTNDRWTGEIARGACQIAVYGAGLVAIYSRYGAGSVRQLFAIRGTSWGFYAIALVLGIAAAVWINPLFNYILEHYPIRALEDQDDAFATYPLARKLAIAVVTVLVAPVLEEGLFRGAIFGSLRKTQGVALNVFIVALLFAMAHIMWQSALPIFPLALAMCLLRQLSGSIFPSLLLHAAFNGTALLGETFPKVADRLVDAHWKVGLAFVVSLLLVVGALRVGEGGTAGRARASDA